MDIWWYIPLSWIATALSCRSNYRGEYADTRRRGKSTRIIDMPTCSRMILKSCPWSGLKPRANRPATVVKWVAHAYIHTRKNWVLYIHPWLIMTLDLSFRPRIGPFIGRSIITTAICSWASKRVWDDTFIYTLLNCRTYTCIRSDDWEWSLIFRV